MHLPWCLHYTCYFNNKDTVNEKWVTEGGREAIRKSLKLWSFEQLGNKPTSVFVIVIFFSLENLKINPSRGHQKEGKSEKEQAGEIQNEKDRYLKRERQGGSRASDRCVLPTSSALIGSVCELYTFICNRNQTWKKYCTNLIKCTMYIIFMFSTLVVVLDRMLLCVWVCHKCVKVRLPLSV